MVFCPFCPTRKLKPNNSAYTNGVTVVNGLLLRVLDGARVNWLDLERTPLLLRDFSLPDLCVFKWSSEANSVLNFRLHRVKARMRLIAVGQLATPVDAELPVVLKLLDLRVLAHANIILVASWTRTSVVHGHALRAGLVKLILKRSILG